MLTRVAVRKMLIDGTQWGAWEPYALPLSDQLVTLWTPVGTEMRWAVETWQTTSNNLHFWWPGARYLIGARYEGARFAGCYCDVVLPLADLPAEAPRREYVDLYLDLVVRADRSWYTKDHEIYDRAEQVIPPVRPRARRAATHRLAPARPSVARVRAGDSGSALVDGMMLSTRDSRNRFPPLLAYDASRQYREEYRPCWQSAIGKRQRITSSRSQSWVIQQPKSIFARHCLSCIGGQLSIGCATGANKNMVNTMSSTLGS